MRVILADVNAQSQAQRLASLMQAEWPEFWDDLELVVRTFGDVGLPLDASDLEVWQLCQAEDFVLLTDNRNHDSPDSLEATIRRLNTSDSLPVFTISDLERFGSDRDFSGLVVDRFYEFLLRLDELRGTGRLYLP
ncbi:MAG: hypothetical protein WD066_00560 [Planctomycetaceae bacterium]